jgi:WD40 repeat protein
VTLKGVTVYDAATLPLACYGEGCNIPAAIGRFVATGTVNPEDVFISPDGKNLAVLEVDRFAVDIYDTASGQLARTLVWAEHAAPVLSGVVFSPDWRTLAWIARGGVLLMDVASGGEGLLLSHEDFVQSVAFTADGSWLASAAMGTLNDEFIPVIRVWNVSDGSAVSTLAGHTAGVRLLKFSADGRWLAAAGEDGSLTTWEVSQTQPLSTLGGVGAQVLDLTITPDGENLLAAYADGSARLWKISNAQELNSWNGLHAAVSPAGSALALGSLDGWLDLFDPLTAQKVDTLGIEPQWTSLGFSPDGRILTAYSPNLSTVNLWDVASGTELDNLSVAPDLAADVAIAPDGKTVAAGGYGCHVRLWDALSGEMRGFLKPDDPECDAEPEVTFSPDGSLLAVASSKRGVGAVSLWETASWQELQILSVQSGSVESLAFSPDGQLLAVGTGETDPSGNVTGGTAWVWEVSQFEEIGSFRLNNWVTSLAFSPDAQILAIGSAAGDSAGLVAGSLIELWDLESRRRVHSLSAPGYHVVSLAFSPDGQVLASGNWNGDLVLWNPGTGEKSGNLGQHDSPVRELAFSPDGDVLAAAILTSGAGSIELWNVETREVLTQLQGDRVAFSPDGRFLASIVFSSVRLWGVVP